MGRFVPVNLDKKPALSGFYRLLLVVVGVFGISVNSYAQEEEQKRLVNIYPTAGITWRSTVMNFFNFSYIFPEDPTQVYTSEKNVQGLSLNTGLLLKVHRVGIEYYPNFRYDITNGVIGDVDAYEKDFIIDHNINVSFDVSKRLDVGVGMSVVNVNKGYHFINPGPRYHDIEFKTYNVFAIIPINRFHLELKAQYMPKGYPYNTQEKYICYSIRAHYRFDFLNKKRKEKK